MPRSRSRTGASTPEASDGAAGVEGPAVARRAVLRRAATVAAAGIGGIAAAEILTAGPASAASGDDLVLGSANDSGSGQTTLTSSTTAGSTLKLSNTAAGGGAPVLLASSGSTDAFAPTAGRFKGGELMSLTSDGSDTLFWWTADNAAGNLQNLAVVLTTATGTVFNAVEADRIVDTRSTAGRALITSATKANLDSSHRLKAGKTIKVDLSPFVNFAYAVHLNVMVISALGDGYATVWGSGSRPTASTIHYRTSEPIHNGVAVKLDSSIELSVYSEHTAHIILDVHGWTLPDFSFMVSNDNNIRTPDVAAGKAAGTKQANDLGVVARKSPRRTREG